MRRAIAAAGLIGVTMAATGALVIGLATASSLTELPRDLRKVAGDVRRAQILAQDGTPLTVSYTNRFNAHDRIALHAIPALLVDAFIEAEDRRFRSHGGVDWRARVAAVVQNLRAWRRVRGASTISEQVIRMLTPRPRTVWTRWVEGFDAARLEARVGKDAVLEFYLNQIPFSAQRRGVVQAARLYFGRDLDTLSPKEMLVLAVLVRAPTRLDPLRAPGAAEGPMRRLADRMLDTGALSHEEHARVIGEPLVLATRADPIESSHFVRFVRSRADRGSLVSMRTTLDRALQRHAQALLDSRLRALAASNVAHGAALIVDHRSNAVRAWVVGRARAADNAEHAIDAVLTPRQPGSTLKPFVYALALERGWSAATLIEDAPLSQAVGSGLHAYRNYSRRHYGWLTLREALGNSLNVPAVKAMQYVGSRHLLDRLHRLGVRSLDAHPDRYGDGLALGNGEVSLYELTEAYAALANRGVHRPLRHRLDEASVPGTRVFEETTASIIADVLSDAAARRLEFGDGGVLSLPVQTAVKTGTSSDYRDAWAIGFDHRHVVGVWMGNLDSDPTDHVTGSTGPALTLRALFARLSADGETRGLHLSHRLERHPTCLRPLDASGRCSALAQEWFAPATGTTINAAVVADPPAALRIRHPSPGLRIALDPRIPDALEAFRFELSAATSAHTVRWRLDGQLVAETSRPQYLWRPTPGMHTLEAELVDAPNRLSRTPPVRFEVR